MIISNKSWHYRLISKLDFDIPTNLCAYFWMTVLAVFFAAFAISAITAVTSLALIPFWWTFSDVPLAVVMFIGLVEITALTLVLHDQVQVRYIIERRAGEREPVVVTEPGLFRLWLRAKHRKVCPLIEFK